MSQDITDVEARISAMLAKTELLLQKIEMQVSYIRMIEGSRAAELELKSRISAAIGGGAKDETTEPCWRYKA